MRAARIGCLSLGFLLAVATASRAQDEEPIDYKSKPIAKWIEGLKDKKNFQLRHQARQALGPNGPYAKEAVPALIDAFGEKQPPVFSEVAETLADYGPAVAPALLQALKRPESAVRAGVAEALGYVWPRSKEAISSLLEAIKDSAPEVRAAAAGSLGKVGRSSDQAIRALASALPDDHENVREVAAAALAKMGRRSKPALPALILALKDKNEWVRHSAAEALGKIGPDARAAIPGLIEGLQNKKNGFSRSTMAQALGGIGPDAKTAVPALLEALQEKEDSFPQEVFIALGEIGPGAKGAVPALIAAVKDKDNADSFLAICALGKLGPGAKAAVPVLMELLPTGELHQFDYTVAEALGGIGPAASAAVPTLTLIARDRLAEPEARKAAAEAVTKIDPAFAAKEGMQYDYLDIRLGNVPAIKLAPRTALSQEKKERIQKLIAALAEVETPAFGMSATVTGHAFAPLPGQEHFQMGLLTNHRLKSSNAFRNLVELGPEALPFLLEALGDKTPTKLKIEPFGMMGFGAEISGNPLNPLERRVLAKEISIEDSEEEGLLEHPYTLKVGDVCFVAIGQIVGRPYQAVRYQPTAIIVINSPVENQVLRERVRVLWVSADPTKKLLDSLLLDYATEGVFNGKTLNGWGEGSDWQIQAALRLLYYFPKEAAPLIATRLRSLDVKQGGEGGWMAREVKNRVMTAEFIQAITWSTAPAIKEALADIAKRTDDPAVKEALDGEQKRNP